MREFKFRAWDSTNKWMDLGPFWVGEDGSAWEEPQERFDTPHTEITRSLDIVILQYTGLKDKNGKEIYEGDILEYYNAMAPKGSDPKVKRIVMWLGYRYVGIDSYDIAEVIGNVYENPELMG